MNDGPEPERLKAGTLDKESRLSSSSMPPSTTFSWLSKNALLFSHWQLLYLLKR